jgi:ABC-type branched-subunit amino acid transport system ATPase component
MAELVIEHLSLRFGGLTVLDDVSFAAEAGELFALIGPNGAGKTSVLNCISGIYRGTGAIRLRGNDIEAVERIIDVVELERYRHAPVGALPFGVQKIVGFARALALEPTVMLLDEPSAGLNREERENLARFILRIKHELNMTIVWIEHDMQMIADLADCIHVLDYGRTLAEGAPASVLTDPGVLAAYLGTATSPGRRPI